MDSYRALSTRTCKDSIDEQADECSSREDQLFARQKNDQRTEREHDSQALASKLIVGNNDHDDDDGEQEPALEVRKDWQQQQERCEQKSEHNNIVKAEGATSPLQQQQQEQAYLDDAKLIHLAPGVRLGNTHAQSTEGQSAPTNSDEWSLNSRNNNNANTNTNTDDECLRTQVERTGKIRECSQAKSISGSESAQSPPPPQSLSSLGPKRRQEFSSGTSSDNHDLDKSTAAAAAANSSAHDSTAADLSSSIETSCSIEEQEEPPSVLLNVNVSAHAHCANVATGIVGDKQLDATSGLEFGANGFARGAKGVELASCDLDCGERAAESARWGCEWSERVGADAVKFKAGNGARIEAAAAAAVEATSK